MWILLDRDEMNWWRDSTPREAGGQSWTIPDGGMYPECG
jgi:hypothetical protein